MMIYLASVISGILGVYMFLLCVRIILTWFPGLEHSGPMYFLRTVCDPYLNWFRRFRIFRAGPLDFSPIIAIAVLSLVRGIFTDIGFFGNFSPGRLLAMVIGAFWSVLSWILGFFIIILILRLIAYVGNCNIYSPFWRFVDFIAQPVMYRICRIFFPARILNYLTRIIFSLVILVIIFAGLWAAVSFGISLLYRR
jgi:YggT family protein